MLLLSYFCAIGIGRIKSKEVLITKKTPSFEQSYSEPACCTSTGFKANIETYLIKSTLHGLRYIGDKNITILERYNYIYRLKYQHWKKMIVAQLPARAGFDF